MLETMYAAPGVGLAGPQVGISLRMFVFDDGETGPQFVANPLLEAGSGELREEEGCLSIPGPTMDAAVRPCHVPGPGYRRCTFEMTGEGLLARIFQHETDHLEGMLFIDRLDDDGRRSVMAELRRIELEIPDPKQRRLLRRGEA